MKWVVALLVLPLSTQSTQEPLDHRVNQLVEQLGSEDAGERDEAAEALFWMGRKAVPALRNARKQGSSETRQRASDVLSRLDPGAVEGLRLRLIPGKDRYELGEAIEIVVELKNVSKETLTIFKWPNPMASWTRGVPLSKVDWAKRKWSDDADPFVVRTREGKLLENHTSTPEKGPGKDFFIPLAPDESHREKCVLNWGFDIVSPGIYRVDAAYSDTFFSLEQAREKWKLDPWTGFLRSNTLILEVVSPTEVSLGNTARRAERGDLTAIKTLALARRPEWIPALQKALAHPDVEVRRDATNALVWIGGDSAVPILIDQARTETDRKLRVRTIYAAGYLAEERALKAFTSILDSDAPDDAKVAVIHLARELGRRSFVPELRRVAFKKGVSESVRIAAFSLLGDWRVEEAIPAIRRVAFGESTPQGERKKALYTLAEMGDPETLDWGLRNIGSGEQRYALRIIGQYRSEKATEALRKVALDPKHARRASAMSYLAHRGDSIGYPQKIKLFRSIVERYVKARGRMTGYGGNIFDFIADFEGFFLRPFLRKEGGLSNQELEPALEGFDAWWRENGEDFDLREARLTALTHPVRRIRQYAAEGFRTLPDERALEPLKKIVRDGQEDKRVRRAAATTLLAQGDLSGLDFLLEHMDDQLGNHQEWYRSAKLATHVTGRGFFESYLTRPMWTQDREASSGVLLNRGYEWLRTHREKLTWNPRMGIYEIAP